MPVLREGNIFERFCDNDVAIIFGHIGFNQMGATWHEFQESENVFQGIEDPFSEIPNEPHEIREGKFIWFVPEANDGGMEDMELIATLDRIFSWIEKTGHMRIVMNGIRDIGHWKDTEQNRRSDNGRVRLLILYSIKREKRARGLRVELISLNDAFVRNEHLI